MLLCCFVGMVIMRCWLGLRIFFEVYDLFVMIFLVYFMVLIKVKGLGVRWWMNGKGWYEVVIKSV